MITQGQTDIETNGQKDRIWMEKKCMTVSIKNNEDNWSYKNEMIIVSTDTKIWRTCTSL